VFRPVVQVDDCDKEPFCAVPKVEEERNWPCALPKREWKEDPCSCFLLNYSAALTKVLIKSGEYFDFPDASLPSKPKLPVY